MKRAGIAVLALSALALGGCATMVAPQQRGTDAMLMDMLMGQSATKGSKLTKAIKDASAHPLGSEKNPIRASMPPGQRAYLGRLRCGDGKAPTFSRVGSMGLSPYGNIVDGYDVRCTGSEPAKSLIHMDMYHSGYVEKEAVPGFAIVD